jgi:hypothetical protein
VVLGGGDRRILLVLALQTRSLRVSDGAGTVPDCRAGRLPHVPSLAIAALGVVYASLLIWVIPHLEQAKVVPVSRRATA